MTKELKKSKTCGCLLVKRFTLIKEITTATLLCFFKKKKEEKSDKSWLFRFQQGLIPHVLSSGHSLPEELVLSLLVNVREVNHQL